MRIPGANKTAEGFFEARPGDVAAARGLVLVDVRDLAELTDVHGHIHGVRHVPMERVLAEGLPDVGPDAAVVFVCRSGRRSAACAARLASKGHAEVYNLVGGMIRWNAEEYPVARTPTWK